MKGFNLSEWAIRHRSLVAYFMLVLVIAGIASYFRLGRSEDPAFTIKTMVVQALWPGATIDDTLLQVTERLERKLQETPNLDYLRSYTTAGQTTIFVNLKGETPAAQVPDIWYQVRKKVGDIRSMLPQGIVGPGFNDEFGDTYGIVYGFTADGFTHRELRDYVDDVRSRLLQVPDVSKIDVIGAQDERIYVEFSAAQLAGLGINRSALIAALQAQNAVTPAGVVQTGDEKILLRISGAFRSEHDILAINFAANGRLIRLGDIARVARGPADPPQPIFRVNGQDAIGLAIAMREGGDILTLGRNVEQAMAEIIADLPIGIEPKLVAKQPVTVENAVDEFMEALWEAVAIVLAVSFISLGLRAGAVVALSIPLVLAIVFVAMEFFGIDLQRVSLGALIIALGLLVDDAMITVETMITRLEHGDDKDHAATFAYTSTAFPMLTGTLVTVAGFVPIGFARSAAGEYTFSIFAVVAIALIVSWIVAVLFAPLLGVWILKKPKTAHSGEPGPVMRAFRRLLILAMRARWITILATLVLFGAALYGTRFVPQQFFPSSDRPELLVDLKLPQNASIYATQAVSTRLDDLLKGDETVDRWSTYVGRGAVRFYLPLNVQLPNDFFAQAVIVTKGLEQRERLKARLEQTLETEFPSVVGRVYPLELGPPVGWPLQYRVSGSDADQVREIAFRLAQFMATDARVQKINYDWIEPARTVQIRVDQDQARLMGLSSQDLAQVLNTVVSGATVTQMRDGIYLVDVVTRASAEQRASLATIRTLQVPLPNGQTVPLTQIASIAYGQEYPLIWRRDRKPTLTVQADVAPGILPAPIVRALSPKIDALNAELPAGYRVVVGGTDEESGKSQASVIAVVPVMLFLMLTILMIQLQSFHRLFLVLSVAPFGPDRGRRGSPRLRQATRLRGDPRRPGADRDDRPQLGDPDRPGRDGESPWAPSVGCGDRGDNASLPADPAHCCGRDPRHDSHRPNDLLGPDGLRDHGRSGGRDASDPGVSACALRCLVPDQTTRSGGSGAFRSQSAHNNHSFINAALKRRRTGRVSNRRGLAALNVEPAA
ncbi:multidrug efflux pump subunit AcrB [Microvirga subterranea]|uniref:Multidrug efflux pump subunit AcrB n=1 Tax=Microvirga subterranea TaxID=186651 RepID=A0A370H3Q6_9HYPH|nr:multidrug efflux pump subunit AcrB [Microvirga subterranea]